MSKMADIAQQPHTEPRRRGPKPKYATEEERRMARREQNRKCRETHLEQRREQFKKWYQKNKEYTLSRTKKWRDSHRKHIQEYNREYKATHKETVYKSLERAKVFHPVEHEARQMVYNAKRSGKLVPSPCEVCGSSKSEAHHDNYNNPLEVRWLCKKCHVEWHKCHEPRRAERSKI